MQKHFAASTKRHAGGSADDWKRRVADSKFSRMPDYGLAHSGHIALQSHGDPVWFRNVRIRGLAP